MPKNGRLVDGTPFVLCYDALCHVFAEGDRIMFVLRERDREYRRESLVGQCDDLDISRYMYAKRQKCRQAATRNIVVAKVDEFGERFGKAP